MSFKWKWIVATVIAQMAMGIIFAAIQYVHLGNIALKKLEDINFEIQQAAYRISDSRVNKKDILSTFIRGVHSQYRPLGVWVDDAGHRVVEFGTLFNRNQLFVPKEKNKLALQISLNIPNHVLWVIHDPEEVFRERNDMIVFLVGIFSLSAIAVTLILMALSNALLARLEVLRNKALDLQAGDIKARIPVVGGDEISDLGKAFNRMAQAIEQQLSELEQSNSIANSERNRLDLLLSSLGSGVAYLDEHFTVLYMNKGMAKMMHLPYPFKETPKLEELLQQAGLLPEQMPLLRDFILDFFGNHSLPVELDFEEGRVIQLRFVVYNDQVNGPHGVLIAEDVSIRKNVEDLRNEVERDPLTAVMNRRGFDLTLSARIARRLPGEAFGLLMLDLDGFKAVNDSLGHKAGDQVLKTSAQVLKAATRNADYVARLGGDEFAILVTKCTPSLLVNIAERVIDGFAEDKHLGRLKINHNLNVTCSIGGVMFPMHAESEQDLIEVCDKLMYEAKKSGKNCYRMPQGMISSKKSK